MLNKEILDYELEDDNCEFGGTSFYGETVQNFLDETENSYEISIEELNEFLKMCGIKEVAF